MRHAASCPDGSGMGTAGAAAIKEAEGRVTTQEPPTILNALIWLLATGAPWRDLPERYGPWRTVATRYYRWLHSGLWRRLMASMQREADAKGALDWDVHMIDGTNVRAHRHAAGARGGHPQALGRSRGGFGSKLHLRCDRQGKPLVFVLTAGERNERTALPELMSRGAVRRSGSGRPKLRPRAVVGDRGYTGKPSRDHLRDRGIGATIPQVKTEKVRKRMDWRLYRERNVVERLVGRLKEYRRIATRYDKLAESYLAFVQLAAIRLWL
jgi:transposase